MHTESYTGEQVTHRVPHQQELNRQEPLGKVLYKGSIILEGFFLGGGDLTVLQVLDHHS